MVHVMACLLFWNIFRDSKYLQGEWWRGGRVVTSVFQAHRPSSRKLHACPQKLQDLCYSPRPAQMKAAVAGSRRVVPPSQEPRREARLSLLVLGAAACARVTRPRWLVEEGARDHVLQVDITQSRSFSQFFNF